MMNRSFKRPVVTRAGSVDPKLCLPWDQGTGEYKKTRMRKGERVGAPYVVVVKTSTLDDEEIKRREARLFSHEAPPKKIR